MVYTVYVFANLRLVALIEPKGSPKKKDFKLNKADLLILYVCAYKNIRVISI